MWYDFILDFVKVYWRDIFSVILLILSFILCLVRKKPVFNQMANMFQALSEHLPTYINLAETGALSGASKKNLVMNLCRDFLIKHFNFDHFDSISDLVSDMIEDFLSTPQKK